MRIAYFTHSLRSCWNHGNAHFLRGVLRELIALGHDVEAFEPEDSWSVQNLLADHGQKALDRFGEDYPELASTVYPADADLAELVDDADLVIIHEWNDPELVAAIGRLRARGANFTLLFHDTHHRAVSAPKQMRAYDLDGYDGVLAFGQALADVYRRWGWGDRVFVWHEAADIRRFHPPTDEQRRHGLVWIGNWGDDERSEELVEFLLQPAQWANIPLDIYGVRYPAEAKDMLWRYGARYHGWVANADAPELFARHMATVHVPRRFYREALPGIPTIRVFEALACGIPLVSAPWEDSEHLFRVGEDFLMVEKGEDMIAALTQLKKDRDLRQSLAKSGLETIRARHTCAHRARELLSVVQHVRSCRAQSRRERGRDQRRAGTAGDRRMKIAFYGSSLLSSWWNGAATYYRGLLRDLASRGHDITFYEPDAYDRQQHRDMEPQPWAKSVVYPATAEGLRSVLSKARDADVVVKASGVGVFDEELIDGIIANSRDDALRIFWDVDAAATLDEMLEEEEDHPVRRNLSSLDLVLTYGGGPPVVEAYERFGAARCVPIYNALDPDTHHPVASDPRFAADLSFLGNRLPDREARVESFFLAAAEALPERQFLIGGNGWDTKPLPFNVRNVGHVFTTEHNAVNCTPLAVLNIARDSMANIGFSPATRVFEAAGAAACLITDAWEGIELFLEPDKEVLVARDGWDVADHVAGLTPERARDRGQAALKRVLSEHTYTHRGAEVDRILRKHVAMKREPVVEAAE